MTTITWSQLTFLSSGQQAKAAQFAAIGAAVRAQSGTPPDLSQVTQSQAKAAEVLLKDLMSFIDDARRGIAYARSTFEAAALQAFQDANP